MKIPPIHTLPSPGPTYELYLRSDDNYSEFPAPLVNESTPDQPSPQPSPPPCTQRPRDLYSRLSSSPDHPPQPSQLRQSAIQHPRRGFTTKDISNTVKASKSSSSRKRKIEALNIPEDSLKRKQKKTSTHVDIDLLRGKIENVMGRIGEMETLLNDINSTLEDILYTVA